MKKTQHLAKKIILLTLLLVSFSCSHHPKTQDFADTANPHEELLKLENNLGSARAEQADVLSPTNFKQAEEYTNDAKRSLHSERENRVILHEIAQAQAYLDEANKFSKLSRANMEEVVIARKAALDAGVLKHEEDDFEALDRRLKDVTSKVERNKLDDAIKKRSELQLAYLDIELKSIKEERLGSARSLVEKSIDEGAKKFAPRSLAITEKSIQDADAFITAKRHETGEVSLRSDEAYKQAQHLLKITRDSKSGKRTSSEELALIMENEKNKATSRQEELDKTREQLAEQDEALAEGDRANLELQTTNTSLESEQSLHKLYEDARAQFSEDEAEVYKKGKTLTVRLKGLEFPSSKAELDESNYPLLAKVQKVIDSFGRSNVTVEGHTDSIGGKASNQKLSQNRAKVVSEYFAKNGKGDDVRIKSVGYGYQKPLASNKTESGRAQNRRVDVLIRPVTSL